MPTSYKPVFQLKLTRLTDNTHDPATALSVMQEYHGLLLSICDRLEAIADTLPVPVNVSECRFLSQELLPSMKASHRFEEERFFMSARLTINGGAVLDDVIARLCEEHREDQFFAEEICEEMRILVAGTHCNNAEVTGYMLRGFFGQMRRHIAFERDFLCIPMAQRLAKI
ncbi:MAG: hemerythrin domain-containing protein [Alphaproteobacteria bacterium]|nr:hemerythrin domain-containing protein [Alphaproteobacteria bacterium]